MYKRQVIAFQERVTAYIRERTWHPTQSFRTLPDGRLELTMRVAHTVELMTWIQGFGPDAQVMAPTSLADSIAQRLREAAALYGDGT